VVSEPVAEEAEQSLQDAAPVPATPTVADGEVRPLDPAYITLRRQTGLFGWVITTGVLYVGLIVILSALRASENTSSVARIAFWMLTLARGWHAFAWPAISYRHSSYRVDSHGVEARRGVLTRSVVNVPRSRVQHTDVTQGPLERRHGLATLSIHTAGRQHELVMIFGLPHEKAVAIRDFLLPRENVDAV
jgi:membrane protein YdbS with pleckstrin-like domain